MKKLPMAAFAIAATLVALLPVMSAETGRYPHKGSLDQYEIVLNLSDLASIRESGSNPRPVNYEEPA